MSDEILKRIDVLAGKLGVTVEHLWGVLLRQARIEMWMDLAWASIFAAATITAAFYVRRRYREDDSVDVEAIWFIACGLIFMIAAQSAFKEWMSPEFWALKQIIGAAR